MRRFLAIALLLCVMALRAVPADATSFTYNFCGFSGASSTCPAGVTEASLRFTEIANSDPNDYVLDLVIKGYDIRSAFRRRGVLYD